MTVSELRAVGESLARLDERINGVSNQLKLYHDEAAEALRIRRAETDRLHEEFAKRLLKLEERAHNWTGGMKALTAAAGLLATGLVILSAVMAAGGR